MNTGYSGTPLVRKLGYKAGMRVWFASMPDSVLAEIDLPELASLPAPEPGLDAAHLFTASRAELEDWLARMRQMIAPAGFVWISWPKKASKVPTDITEDTIRALCLPMGWVDVKVCSVDAIWSGLKLMIRKELR